MNIKKIIKYIKKSIHKISISIFKRKKIKNTISFSNKIEQKNFTKKRKNFVIKNNSLEKLKFF
jgi:hypothetical protein